MNCLKANKSFANTREIKKMGGIKNVTKMS